MRTSIRARFALLISMITFAGSFAAATPAVTMAVPPPGQDFVITTSDLAFILKQIAISEAHAEDVVTENPNTSPLCGPLATFDDSLEGQTWYEPDGDPCVGSPLLAHGLRTVDGRWNNLQPNQSYYGAGGQVFPRMLEPEWRDAEPIPPFAPSVPGQANPTTYAQTNGFVYDSQPRTISNLTVDETTDNPAAVAVLLRYLEHGLDAQIIDEDGNPLPIPAVPTAENLPQGTIFLQNVASDEGLSAPFSSWMTFFGQFFDHGLDLVEKGGSGTVVVPLQADDPLYVQPTAENPNPPNFLMLTRATNQAGDDGIVGTSDDVHEHRNRTTPFIDQNQTYTSHASHQVFLREYVMVDGRPVGTGQLLDAADGGLATWADVKAQAVSMLGIGLTDLDVLNVPLVRTDPYGRFVADPATGFPQVATSSGFVSGSPAAPLVTGSIDPVEGYVSAVLRANHSFLDDLAHESSPFTSGGDPLSRGLRDPETQLLPAGSYDGDLLDDHFITGDGRGNENIGLTAVHHVFHSEHNRLTGQIEAVLATDPDLADAYEADGYWDYPERLFQAARFFNEMQYQHLAIEEFVRKVQPTVDNPPLNEAAYHSELNAAITAEFAHVVYRFGHSMLTETLPRVYDDGTIEELTLLDGFLNPRSFTKGGTISPDEAAASLVRGLTAQTGNAIDEFVTDTLRNNLLGLPLDLATINMTRARDVGVPSLQSARQTFYDATLDPTLEPYESWEDFRLAMKHPESILNFVAAYGVHPTLDAATTLDAKRAAATALVVDPAFMNLDAEASGLNEVDFWVGGLAERTMPFGGMLGSTFNFVFESQGEHLQNADRFYYLTRNQGRNLFTQLEANSFSELLQRNTTATGLPADVFAFPDPTFYVEDLPACPAALPADSGLSWMTDCTLRFTGGEHIVMYGTDTPDRMRAGDGDDSIWGRAGADRIEGGAGNDSLMGGDGDDIITDLFGDDTIIAGGGNDAVRGGPGGDLLLPGSGNDFTFHTAEITQSFNGPGNDLARGGAANDQMWGNEGDDWLEGGLGHDLVQGDHALSFQNDPNGGHDVLIGGAGNNDLDSDGGDDILVSGPGTDRNEGMLGFDWVTYKGHVQPVNADMRFTGLLPPDVQAIRDRFDFIEGLSGWNGNDILRGMSRAGDLPEVDHGHYLTQEHLDRTAGLEPILRPAGHADYAERFMPVGLAAESEGVNNIFLGGGGSDLIEGRPGDDFIDGDLWLNVELEWRNPAGGVERADDMLAFGERVFSGEINPGDIHIVRSIETPVEEAGVIDTAVYAAAFDAYQITNLGDGYWRVFNNGVDELEEGEGSDIIRNMEQLQFDDQCVWLLTGFPSCPTYGTISFDHDNPVEDEPIAATVEFNDSVVNPTSLNFQWQFGEEAEGWEPSPNSTGLPDDGFPFRNTFTPGDAEASYLLRVVVTFTDDDGQLRSITSAPVANPVLNENDEPMGLVVTPSDPEVGDMLQATGLTDADSIEDVIEDGLITYTWQQNSEDGATDWVDIASGPDPSFRVGDDQLGSQIRVVVTYTDDLDTAEEAISEPTAAVTGMANIPPAGDLVLSTSDPQEGVALTIDASGITDDDGLGAMSYEWQRLPSGGNWTAIVGATGASLTPGSSLIGQQVRVVVSYTDGNGTSESVVSDATEPVVAADPVDPDPVDPGPVDPDPVGGFAPFTDISGSAFVNDIGWLWEEGITGGCTSTAFCPVDAVNRGQMAAFLDRALGLPGAPANYDPFVDDDGNAFEGNIERLAYAGITGGCVAPDPDTGRGGRFCASEAVDRGQMAAFLDRALGLPGAQANYDPFVDDDGNAFEGNIERLAYAGITGGCVAPDPDTGRGGRFCGTESVTRGQMAAFLRRALQ